MLKPLRNFNIINIFDVKTHTLYENRNQNKVQHLQPVAITC